jgi:hypothetical protein
MATTLQVWMNDNRGAYVDGTGRWLVVWCSFRDGKARAERHESYFVAQGKCAEDCGVSCRGIKNHQVVEISEAQAAPRTKLSGSWKRMVADA